MKRLAQIKAIELKPVRIGSREAEKRFASAVKSGLAAISHLQAFKGDYVNSCFDFFIARKGLEHGQWGVLCERYKDKISQRTIDRRVADGELMMKSALMNNPELTSIEEMRRVMLALPLESVKAAVEEMRENEVAIEFGQYYSEDHQAKKLKKDLGQIEFDFSEAEKTLSLLCSPKVKLPLELAKVEELVGTLKSATLRAERHLKELKNTVEAQ